MMHSWHQELWQQLVRSYRENRLPHALLFSGPAGLGKRQLAEAYAQLVLCKKSQEAAASCGHCHSCQLMSAQSHPDFYLVQPEQEGQAIKIDQIRELSEFIQKTSHQGGYRVVLIQPAEAMNSYAANALLKTLEEPTPNTLIMVISDQKAALLPTIRSRCQLLRFSAPAEKEALAWLTSQNQGPAAYWKPILQATQGAPLLALAWHQQGVWLSYQDFMRDLLALSKQEADPLQLAVQWKDASILWVFDMFFQWLIKLMRVEQQVATEEEIILASLPAPISMLQLLEFADYLQNLRVEASGPYHLNQQLLLESLFIVWSQYATR